MNHLYISLSNLNNLKFIVSISLLNIKYIILGTQKYFTLIL